MKTKIKYIIGYLFFIFSGFQTYANLTATDGVTAETSGLRYSYYEVTWCSPHAGRLSDTRFSASNHCQKGYFHDVGGVGKMTYKGENFANGNVKLNSAFPSTTRTSGSNFINFFDGINTIAFEGEGTYTIRILLVDYAFNASKFEFSYKIDKTAPQFQLTGIEDHTNHPNIFVSTIEAEKRLTGLSGSIVKYDSNTHISNDRDKYTNPTLHGNNDYTGDIPQKRTGHTRNDLYVVYFKGSDTATNLENHPFQLNVSYSDSYSDSYNDHMRGGNQYLAGEKDFSLLTENEVVIFSGRTVGNTITLETVNLTSNNSLNSQAKYKVRLYDNTVGKDPAKTPNYSEIIFYAVRDNTKPNMGGNSLAGTDTISATQKLLKFNDNSTHVWDTNVKINPEDTGSVAKFISANNHRLYSSLADKGITGNGQISGSTTADKYAWYNAGIRVNNVKIKIEQSNDKDSFSDVFTYDNRFENNKNRQKDFTKVDNDRSNGYRKYSTEYLSHNDMPGICDAVGNCLNPKVDFRVVANTLATTTSNVSLALGVTTDTNRIFANGTDSYHLTTQLRDSHGNAIVGVTAVENENKVIKRANITFNFDNGLHYNQLDNSGSKGVIIQDLLTSKNQTSNTGTINSIVSNIFFQESPETTYNSNKGTYKFSVASKVPSVGAYPYLASNSLLILNSINPKAITNGIDEVGIYPPNATGALGLFDNTQTLSGNDNFLSINTDFLNNNDYKSDLDTTASGSYGAITLNNESGVLYNTLNLRKIEFDFASPAIYGTENFSLSHLINNIGATQNHTKLGYKFGGLSYDPVIFEQYLPSYTGSTVQKPRFTPDIFNIFSNWTNVNDVIFDNSKINNGTGILFTEFSDNTRIFKTKSTPIHSNYQIAGHGFNMGYISSLTYDLGVNTIKLPSISRNVGSNKIDDSSNIQAKRSSGLYFLIDSNGERSYVILGDPIISAGLLSAMGIAITGMSNSQDLMIVDKDAGRKANLNVGENLTRYDLMTLFKQNIEKNSRGITWCKPSIGNVYEISDLNTNLGNCTININGEKISFIEGNIDIYCSSGNNCILDNNLKRTIIVKDGSTYIKSNISTFGKNSKLLIGTIASLGLKNINILNSDNPELLRDNKTYGWTFIDPNVTNIDAFIVSQGPMVSYYDDGTTGKIYNAPTQTQLKNQLHVYGSILSLNTVGGYKSETDSKCPYIVENCDQKTAFIFDLVTLRRYSLEGTGPGSTDFSPSGDGMRSGRKTSEISTDGGNPPIIQNADTCTAGTDNLRCVTDVDYIVYPLFVERDINWNKSPSIMFRSDR